jgi:hypothetical protein
MSIRRQDNFKPLMRRSFAISWENPPGTPSAETNDRSCWPWMLKHESPIERGILDYLRANPDSQDTPKGIAEWWLLKQRIQESASEVEAAVASLVAKGKLSARSGADGQIHYRLRKRDSIRKRKAGSDHGMVG